MFVRFGATRGAAALVVTAFAALGLEASFSRAAAQDDPAYPAATCAALWTAHARTPLGPGKDPLGFRDEAVRRSGDAEAVDAFIATQTTRLTDLIYAYIDLSDRESRELFETLIGTCERFEESTPQIAAPRAAAPEASQPALPETPLDEPSG